LVLFLLKNFRSSCLLFSHGKNTSANGKKNSYDIKISGGYIVFFYPAGVPAGGYIVDLVN
jgi:hypothetical protein